MIGSADLVCGRRPAGGLTGAEGRLVTVWVIVIVFFAALSEWTLADVARTVLVVRGEASQSLYDHVRNEIGMLGWRVTSVEELPEGSSLEQAARAARGSAALQLARGRVELWIADRDTGETALFETLAVSESEHEDVMALRVVEVLRARLLRLGFVVETAAPTQQSPEHSAQRRPSEPTTPSAVLAADEKGQEPAPPELWIGASAVAGLKTGRLGPTLHGQLGVRWFLSSWSLAVDAFVPVTSSQVSAPAGEADVLIGLAAATGDYAFDVASDAKALVGATAAAVFMRSGGLAREGFEGRVDWVVVGAAMGHLGWWHRLGSSLALRLDARVGAAIPRPVVKLDDRVEGWWGRPVAMAGVGLEYRAF